MADVFGSATATGYGRIGLAWGSAELVGSATATGEGSVEAEGFLGESATAVGRGLVSAWPTVSGSGTANAVTCRFCGQSISFVRSNTPSMLTAWKATPINADTSHPQATLFARAAGHSPHGQLCTRSPLWIRRTGGVMFIPTDPSAVGLI